LAKSLAECSKHLGRCRPWFWDGRDAPSAEGSTEGNDGIGAERPIHYHHSVIQKGFNSDEEEAQALIQSYTHP
jgi:hypothetical protein